MNAMSIPVAHAPLLLRNARRPAPRQHGVLADRRAR